jgi:hypothetical protein
LERWHKLDHASQRQYTEGDMSGYKATRSMMGDMAKSLERDPQLESILLFLTGPDDQSGRVQTSIERFARNDLVLRFF